jgi:hypothetical protein
MTPFEKLLNILERLDQKKLSYELSHLRESSVCACVRVPGQYWEIEVIDDGSVEVEVFTSDGMIYDEAKLGELFAKDPDQP